MADPNEGSDASTERAASVERQLADTKSDKDGSTATPADEQPVSESDVTSDAPDSPKGVGTSTTRSGEDVAGDDGKESGRHDAGAKGGTDRPAGGSDERDKTGIDP